MLFDRVARAPVEAAARTGRGMLVAELERTVELLAASEVPEHLARTLVDQRVVERVLAELPMEEIVDRTVDRLVATGALERVVVEIVDSPAFRHAAERRGSRAADALRRRCARWDDVVEAHVRRWVHRRDARAAQRQYAGVVSRGVALVVDSAIVHTLFIAAVGSVTLVTSLLHVQPGATAAAIEMSVFWLLLVGTYFTASWSITGATPGMRLLAVRVTVRDGRIPSVGRALLRTVWLVIAIIPVLLGFVPALVDSRRRALQDYVAGTVVVRDVSEP